MSTFLPTVSLVIPMRNSARTLGECLDSVRALDYPPERMEVIVVDNGSTDASADIARQKGYPPVYCARPGASAARNTGITAAKNEIAAFLDSDAAADSNWLRRLVEPFENPEVGGVGGRIDPMRVETNPERHAVATHVLVQKELLAGSPPYILPFAATANAAYRVAVLRQVGGFDETLAICEDADLAWRVSATGARLVYTDAARVRHHHRAERGPYFRQIFQYGQGTVRLFAKHRKRLGKRVWIAWPHYLYVLRCLARIFPAIVRGKTSWDRVAPLYDFWAGICWSAGRIRESIRHRVLVI